MDSVHFDVLVLIVVDCGEVRAGFNSEPKLIETSGQDANNGEPRYPPGDESDEPSRAKTVNDGANESAQHGAEGSCRW